MSYEFTMTWQLSVSLSNCLSGRPPALRSWCVIGHENRANRVQDLTIHGPNEYIFDRVFGSNSYEFPAVFGG